MNTSAKLQIYAKAHCLPMRSVPFCRAAQFCFKTFIFIQTTFRNLCSRFRSISYVSTICDLRFHTGKKWQEKVFLRCFRKQDLFFFCLRSFSISFSCYICRHECPVLATPIEIIENNKEHVVINKPPSIPCHPTGRYRFNTLPFILKYENKIFNVHSKYLGI